MNSSKGNKISRPASRCFGRIRWAAGAAMALMATEAWAVADVRVEVGGAGQAVGSAAVTLTGPDGTSQTVRDDDRDGVVVITPRGAAGLYSVTVTLDGSSQTQRVNVGEEGTARVAFGASAAGLVAASVDADSAFEQIFVYGARRRATLAIETGASLQVLAGEVVQDMAIRDVEQLTFYAPGTSVNGGQVGFLSIRGVGNDSFSAGTEGSSAFYVDGIYRPRITSVLTDIADVETAEILRGPQGTQFGRNSLGGAINVITRGPTEEFEAEAEAWAGSFDMFRVQGGMSGALAPGRINGRIFVAKEVRDGFIENVSPVGEAPDTLDNKDVITVRGGLDFILDENVTFELRGDWLKSRDTGRVQPIVSGDLRLLNQGAIIPFDDIRKAALDLEPFQDIDDWGLSGTFNIDLDGLVEGLTLTSLTSFREFDNLFQLDGDLTQLNVSTLLFDMSSNYLQQEFLFNYDSGGKWQGIFGLFYFHEKADFVFDINAPFVDNVPPPAVNVLQTEAIKTNAIAAFTDWTWQTSEKLALNAGVRLSWEEKQHDTRVVVGPIGAPFVFNDTGQLIDTENWTAFTPRVSVEYTPNDEHLFYALVSRGFTAGNYSIGQLEPVNPEFAWNYEVGHKAQLFDGRLQTSISLFWMELTDLQVELIGENEFDVTTPMTANIGEARNRGIEFEARMQPAPWLRLSTAVTHLDAKFQRGFAVIEVDGDTFQELILDGNRQTQSPKWSASNSIEVDIETANLGIGGQALLRFEHQYVGEQFAGGNNLGVLNRDADIIEAVNVLNARLTYTFPNERWSMSVVGLNLTDELIISRLTGTEADFQILEPDLVTQSKLPGDPRTWAVVLRFKY